MSEIQWTEADAGMAWTAEIAGWRAHAGWEPAENHWEASLSSAVVGDAHKLYARSLEQIKEMLESRARALPLD